MREQTPPSVEVLRRELAEDVKQVIKSGCREEWLDSSRWPRYMGENGHRLYLSYSDEELLDMLRQLAAQLGRPPSQKELFCVYRIFIRRRFKNWPTALRMAGLKEPKRVIKSNLKKKEKKSKEEAGL